MTYLVVSTAGAQGPAGPSVWGGITGTLSTQTDLNNALAGKVDESGGTADSLTVTNHLHLTPGLEPTYEEGKIWYDAAKKALSYYSDVSGSSLQVGFEQWIRVKNTSGGTINDGEVVKVTSASGQTPGIIKAVASVDSNYDVLGIATSNMSNNAFGLVTTSGILHDLNTTGSAVSETWADGDVLYLHPSTPGAMTKTKPAAPNNPVAVGIVLYSHAVNGKILARVLAAGVTDDQIVVDTAPFVGFFDETDTSMHTILNKMDTHTHAPATTPAVAVSYTAGGTTSIAYQADAVYYVTVATGGTSWSITGLPSAGTVASWTIEITNGGLFAQSWFAGTTWDGGTIPTLTSNGLDIITFYTRDGGVTKRAFLAAKDSK